MVSLWHKLLGKLLMYFYGRTTWSWTKWILIEILQTKLSLVEEKQYKETLKVYKLQDKYRK